MEGRVTDLMVPSEDWYGGKGYTLNGAFRRLVWREGSHIMVPLQDWLGREGSHT